MISINLPGATLQFPDDAPIADIRAAIDEHAKGPDVRRSALDQWADQYVANERRNGGFGQTVSDTVRSLARGTPVGSWLDEANAGTAALFGTPYDEAKAYQGATDRAVDRDMGMAGTAAQIAGGLASIPAAPSIAIARGSALLPQMGNMAATGGLYGLLYGAGEGDSAKDRGANALTGAGLGMGLGAGAAAAGKGISNAAGYVADRFKGLPGALGAFEPGAVRRVARAAGDDIANAADIPTLAQRFGNEGMIADLGPNLQGQIGAIARTPGEGKAIALEALNNRTAGAGSRITNELNQSLGPEINMPAALDQIQRQSDAAAGPLYRQFRQTPIPYTPALEDVLATLRNEPGVLRDARRLTDLDSASGRRQFFASFHDDGRVTIDRVPNAAEWDNIKRALDGLAFSPSSTRNDRRIYGGLSGRIKSEIDSVLSPGDPSQSIWARARAASAEGTGLREALTEGRQAFTRTLSPDEMAAARAGMSGPEQLAYTVGGRQAIRDTMGNAATKWGANDDSAARRMLGSDYAREKLRMLAGNGPAQRITGRLDTETAFDRTREAARGNSITAAAAAAQKEFPNVADSGALAREIGAQSLTGLGLRGVKALADALTGGAISESRAAIASDAARILTAQGQTRDQIARTLMQYRNSQGATQAGKAAIDRIARALAIAPRQALIERASQ